MTDKPTWSPRKLKVFILINQKANFPELHKQKGFGNAQSFVASSEDLGVSHL